MEDVTKQDIMDFNRKLYQLYISNDIDMTSKNRLFCSVAISDIRKIGYFTEQKIEKCGEKYGNKILEWVFNPEVRAKQAIMARPGKFFKHIAPEKTDKEIKDLVSTWLSIVGQDTKLNDFHISIESDIQKYYHEDSYRNDKGSLGASCMKYNRCQEYLEFYDYYNTSILVLKNDNDKIKGRALLWHDVFFSCKDIGNKTFMDRIYTNNENDEQLFIDYAEQNDFVYKEEQSYSNKSDFVYQGDSFYENIKIEPESDFDVYSITYPYLDTLSYMDDSDGELSNEYSHNTDIELDSTNGENSGSSGEICGDCGNRFDPNNEGINIEYHGCICDSCSENYGWCENCESFHTSDEMTYLDNTWHCDYCKSENYQECEECGEWIKNEDVREFDYDVYCLDCYADKIGVCDKCDGEFEREDLSEDEEENGVFCCDCIDQMEKERNEEIDENKGGE